MAKSKYNLYLDGTNKIHVTGGNAKIGKGVFNISLLPSDEPLTKKDGTNINNPLHRYLLPYHTLWKYSCIILIAQEVFPFPKLLL